MIEWSDGYRKKKYGFWFCSLTPCGVFFLQFSALFTRRGIVGFWSKWVCGGTAIALGLPSYIMVTEFLISSGGLLDNAYQELTMNGRMVIPHDSHE